MFLSTPEESLFANKYPHLINDIITVNFLFQNNICLKKKQFNSKIEIIIIFTVKTVLTKRLMKEVGMSGQCFVYKLYVDVVQFLGSYTE